MPSYLKLPTGQDAGNMDQVMVLMTWVKHLESQGKRILFAGMGMPTYPINHAIASHELDYWNKVQSNSAKAREYLSAAKNKRVNESTSDYDKRVAAIRDKVVESGATIPYSNPQGTGGARNIFARALNKWYPGLAATAKDILLPVGGSGALYAIFDFINEKKNKQGVIVTPFPYYSLYKGGKKQNRLHSIRVMQEPGYNLTAKALLESIDRARTKNLPINAFLFCDPNNPLGTVIGEDEGIKIVQALAEFLAAEQTKPADERTPIILDEAYAEMGLTKKPVSLLTLILKHAPWLLENVILIRSATKGASAAGERMAVAYSHNEYYITECLIPGINVYGHAPISAQESFARGLDELNEDQLEEMALFYEPQLRLVYQRAHNMGVCMPDPAYKPDGTFYIMLNLSDLIGQPMHPDAKQAVGNKELIETDQDIVYHLIFAEGIMIAPLSYYGSKAEKGFVRITCSGGDTQLNIIMDKILSLVTQARESKKAKLEVELELTRKLLSSAIYAKPNEDENNAISQTKENAQRVIGKILDLRPNSTEKVLREKDLKDKERRNSSGSNDSDGSKDSSKDGSKASLTSSSSSINAPFNLLDDSADVNNSLTGTSPGSGDITFPNKERLLKEQKAKSLSADIDDRSKLLSQAQMHLYALDRPELRKAAVLVQSRVRGHHVRTGLAKDADAAIKDESGPIQQLLAFHQAQLEKLTALLTEAGPKTTQQVHAVLGAQWEFEKQAKSMQRKLAAETTSSASLQSHKTYKQ